MRKILLILLLFFLIVFVVLLVVVLQDRRDNKDELTELKYGTFSIAGTDSQIVLRDDNTLTVRNYDLSGLEKKTSVPRSRLKTKGAKRATNSPFEDPGRYRLNRQFLDRANSFSRRWRTVPSPTSPSRTAICFYLQFNPVSNTILSTTICSRSKRAEVEVRSTRQQVLRTPPRPGVLRG